MGVLVNTQPSHLGRRSPYIGSKAAKAHRSEPGSASWRGAEVGLIGSLLSERGQKHLGQRQFGDPAMWNVRLGLALFLKHSLQFCRQFLTGRLRLFIDLISFLKLENLHIRDAWFHEYVRRV